MRTSPSTAPPETSETIHCRSRTVGVEKAKGAAKSAVIGLVLALGDWQRPADRKDAVGLNVLAGSDQDVLLHGIFQSWHNWSPVLDRLTAERDVLAPTHLGHVGSPPFEAGQSPRISGWTDAVENELTAAGFDRPDVVGHSLGGWVAMELAKRGRAGSVVAISLAGRYSDEEMRRIATLFRRNRRMARWLLPFVRRVVRTAVGRKVLLAESCADPRRIPPEEAERFVVNLATCPDPGGVIGALRDKSGKAVAFMGAVRVNCPVLIVLPARDRFFTRFHAERYAEALPEGTIEVLPDCGHSAMFDHPELVSSKILSFTATRPQPQVWAGKLLFLVPVNSGAWPTLRILEPTDLEARRRLGGHATSDGPFLDRRGILLSRALESHRAG